jgi:hypothetical protein
MLAISHVAAGATLAHYFAMVHALSVRLKVTPRSGWRLHLLLAAADRRLDPLAAGSVSSLLYKRQNGAKSRFPKKYSRTIDI